MLIDLTHRYIRRKYANLGIDSKILDLQSSTIHYYENPPLGHSTIVFLHGLGTSSSTWIHILPHFAKNFHVLAIDLPGFGFSVLKNGKNFLLYDELLTAVGSVLSQLVHPPFVLVGHSLGGWLAADYAIRFQPVPERLILINPAGISYSGVDEQRRLFDIKDMKSLLRLLNRLWWRYPWYFKIFIPAIFTDLRKRRIAEFVRSVKEQDFLNSRLSQLKLPVALLWGKDDNVIGEQTVEILQQSVSELKTYFLTRCGHVPQLERSEELIFLLDEVLGQPAGKVER